MNGASKNEVIYLKTLFQVIVALLLFITFEIISLLEQLPCSTQSSNETLCRRFVTPYYFRMNGRLKTENHKIMQAKACQHWSRSNELVFVCKLYQPINITQYAFLWKHDSHFIPSRISGTYLSVTNKRCLAGLVVCWLISEFHTYDMCIFRIWRKCTFEVFNFKWTKFCLVHFRRFNFEICVSCYK